MLELIIAFGKFADDTKVCNSDLNNEDRQSHKENLHKISAWSSRWEMPFNVFKCQVLQVGRNKNFDHEMCRIKLKSFQHVTDLGVKIKSNLKFTQQCTKAANKVNSVGLHCFFLHQNVMAYFRSTTVYSGPTWNIRYSFDLPTTLRTLLN